MVSSSRRVLTGVIIGTLIVALGALGGYRLTNSAGSAHGKVVLAQATRTWVSGVGDDANPCSRTAPCKTFAGAISKTAPGGEIDALDPGGFGALTITKSITIDGGAGNIAGVLVSGTNGFVISAGANDVVTLRHLDFEGLGTGLNGVNFLAGKKLFVLDSIIRNFTQAGIAIASAGQVVIKDTTLLNNYYGVMAQDGAVVDLANSVIAGSTSIGLGVQTFGNLATYVHATHNQITHNPYAVWMNHGAGNAQIIVWLSDNDVVHNTNGIYGNTGGTLAAFSFGNNRFANNTTPGAPNGTAAQT